MTASITQAPLGLIVPYATDLAPQDAITLYPDTRFLIRSLPMSSVALENYDHIIDRIADLALDLALDGVAAISLMSTTLSFYRGADFNRQIMRLMYKSSNRPCSTMSQALLNALEVLEAKSVALATVYTPKVNHSLQSFLEENGYQVSGAYGLELSELQDIQELSTSAMVELCQRTWQQHRPADALLLASSSFDTLPALKQASAQLGVPVISSSSAGFWDILRTAGRDSRASSSLVSGQAPLFQLPPPSGPRRN